MEADFASELFASFFGELGSSSTSEYDDLKALGRVTLDSGTSVESIGTPDTDDFLFIAILF